MVDITELDPETVEVDGVRPGPFGEDDDSEAGDADPFDVTAAEADFITDDGDLLPDEVQAELEALAAAELDDSSGLEAALAETQRELARQQGLTRQAVARYREALLAAEPELPEDLVRGDSIEEIDAAVEVARGAVRRIREQVASERPRGFPVGAPARSMDRHGPMTAHEKIAAGLQERLI